MHIDSSIQLHNCPILISKLIHGKRVELRVNQKGKVLGIIYENGKVYQVFVKGIKLDHDLSLKNIQKLKNLLEYDFLITTQGFDLSLSVKGKGGVGPPEWAIDDLNSRKIEPIPASELLGSGAYAASMGGILMSNPWFAGIGITLGMLRVLLSGKEFNEYKNKWDELSCQTTSDREKMNAFIRYIDANLKTNNISLEKFESTVTEEFSKLRVTSANQESLRNLIHTVDILLPHIQPNQNQASLFSKVGTTLLHAAPAAYALCSLGPAAPAALLLPKAMELFNVFLSGFFQIKGQGEPSICVKEVMKKFQEIHLSLTNMNTRLREVELLLGKMYIGITDALSKIEDRVDNIEEVFSYQFSCLQNRIDLLSQRIDKGFIGLIEMRLDEIRGTYRRLAESGLTSKDQFNETACKLITWGCDLSEKSAVIGSAEINTPPHLILTTENVDFHVRYLSSSLLTDFPKLSWGGCFNLFVWAESVDIYIQFRLRLNNFEFNSEPHKKDILYLHQMGEGYLSFIRRLQTSEALFTYWIGQYRETIQDIQVTCNETDTITAPLKKKLLKLDDKYLMIRAYIHLSFSQSRKKDPFLVTFFDKENQLPHFLPNSSELSQWMQQNAKMKLRDKFMEYMWIKIDVSISVLQKMISQKVDALKTKNYQDEVYSVHCVLNRLEEFWAMTYSKDSSMEPKREPLMPCHITNISMLCEGDPFLAAQYGLLEEVNRLINEGVNIDGVDLLTGRTLLHEAVEYGHIELVRLLIQKEAILKKDRIGRTPSDLTTDASILEVLLSAKKPSIGLMRKGLRFKKTASGKVLQNQSPQYLGMKFYDDLVAIIYRNSLEIWNYESEKRLKIIQSNSNCGFPVFFDKSFLVYHFYHSSSGKTCVIDLAQDELKVVEFEKNIYDVPHFDKRRDWILHKERVGTQDTVITNLKTGKIVDQINNAGPLFPYESHGTSGKTIYITCKKNEIVTINGAQGNYQSFKVWDVETKKKVQEVALKGAFYFSANDQYLALQFTNRIEVYDILTHQKLHTFQSSSCQPPIALYKDKLLGGGAIWDVKSGNLLHTFQNIDFQSNSRNNFVKDHWAILVSNTRPKPGKVYVYNLEDDTFNSVSSLSCIKSIFVDEDMMLVSSDSYIEIWDLRTMEKIQEISLGWNWNLSAYDRDIIASFDHKSREWTMWKLFTE